MSNKMFQQGYHDRKRFNNDEYPHPWFIKKFDLIESHYKTYYIKILDCGSYQELNLGHPELNDAINYVEGWMQAEANLDIQYLGYSYTEY